MIVTALSPNGNPHDTNGSLKDFLNEEANLGKHRKAVYYKCSARKDVVWEWG